MRSELREALSSRYRFERELGRGGMATVYLAEDLRHRRMVGIKVLHPEIAATVGAERFLREIEIEAGLTHPHILPVHDSGEAAGLLYYVMPHVEGESLRDRLLREGRLPLADALRIAREVADALDYAHRHGVIHRDIKPGNILLSGSHAWVSDFGVARALRAAGEPELTRSGVAVGTPTYMSPEQVTGEREIDGRTDIYSLGCVLYEMLAGVPPFAAPTARAVLMKRLTETPTPLRRCRQEVPITVETAVSRALEVEPGNRFQSPAELRDVLAGEGPPTPGEVEAPRPRLGGRRPGTRLGDRRLRNRPALLAGATVVALVLLAAVWLGARGPDLGEEGEGAMPPRSAAGADAGTPEIAVLYFDDLGPSQDLGHVAAGLTAELNHRLGQLSGLRVRSLQSVKPFRGTSVPVDSLRRALGVDFLVEGSVIPTAGGLRVSVTLLDAQTGIQLGNETHRAPEGEVTSLLDETSRAVEGFLRRQLGREVRRRELRAATASDEAWQRVWRAESLRERRQPLLEAGNTEAAAALLRQADSLLAQAERLDPEWSDPTVLRGWVAREMGELLARLPGQPEEPWIRTALSHVARALELDSSTDALELRGTLRWDLYQLSEDPEEGKKLLAGALADLRDAVAQDPSRPRAWKTLAQVLGQSPGEFEAAYQAAKRAQEEDRFLREDADIVFRLAQSSLDLEKYEEALAWAREGRRLWPEMVDFPAVELAVLTSSPRVADVEWARALTDTILALSPPHRRELYRTIHQAQLAAVLGHAGAADSSVALLERTLAGADETAREYVAADAAHAWLVLGDRNRALEWLAFDLEHQPHKKAYHARDPWFAPLRSDPRFRALVGEEAGSP